MEESITETACLQAGELEEAITAAAGALVDVLRTKDYHITTAESCTGGLISGHIVDVPGASDVFAKGFVTYSNRAKQDLIGVSGQTLDTYGAVSPQTAREMAEGAANTAKAQVALSATGIAGPGGGSAKKPVGLVYIGCAIRGKTVVEKHRFMGDRRYNRLLTVLCALRLALSMLIDDSNEN